MLNGVYDFHSYIIGIFNSFTYTICVSDLSLQGNCIKNAILKILIVFPLSCTFTFQCGMTND